MCSVVVNPCATISRPLSLLPTHSCRGGVAQRKGPTSLHLLNHTAFGHPELAHMAAWDDHGLGTLQRKYKVVVVGDAATGKTSLLHRYAYKAFAGGRRLTIGVEHVQKSRKETLFFEDDLGARMVETVVHFYDVAGQERARHGVNSYYRNLHAAVFVCSADCIERTLFVSVPIWLRDINSRESLTLHLAQKQHDETNNSDCSCEEKSAQPTSCVGLRPKPYVLLVNKIDIEPISDPTTRAMIDAFCAENGFAAWFETSAKDGTNVDAAFDLLVKKMVEIWPRGEAPDHDAKRSVILEPVKLRDRQKRKAESFCPLFGCV